MEFTASLANRAIGVIRRGQALEPVTFVKNTVDSQDGVPLLSMGSRVISRDNEERRGIRGGDGGGSGHDEVAIAGAGGNP
jgi:hypothetical protein